MSSGAALVHFPDGLTLHTVYFGTADMLIPGLHDTQQEAWDATGDAAHPPSEGIDDDEPVTIWSDYGGGFGWEGRASRTRRRVTRGIFPFGEENPYTGKWVDPPPDGGTFRDPPGWVVDTYRRLGWRLD